MRLQKTEIGNEKRIVRSACYFFLFFSFLKRKVVPIAALLTIILRFIDEYYCARVSEPKEI